MIEDAVPRLAVLNWLNVADVERLRMALERTDLQVQQLDGTRISDAPSLLAGFETLAGRSFAAGGWDALRDILSEIVGRSSSGRSCLIWEHVDAMLHGGLPDLVTALTLLAETSRDLAARNRQFVTFLTGEGPNFPRLQATA